MTTFIADVIADLKTQNIDLSQCLFILPNKRAGIFLKEALSQVIDTPIFSPEIQSIEAFSEQLSGLKKVTTTTLLFSFYSSYLKLTQETDIEPFETVSKWTKTLLQDFDDIDGHLVAQAHIFNYLAAIKKLDHLHWSQEEQQTDFIKKYLRFWNKLEKYYTHFSEYLLKNQQGYAGLIYREAVKCCPEYIKKSSKKTHVFIGFNAINKAQERIIQMLLENNLAQIYWDIDTQFINTPGHDAGHFMRQYKQQWRYFERHPFRWMSEYYENQKNIHITGVPKQIGQAKYVGQLLRSLNLEKTSERSALILADQTLLVPTLNALPETLENINITMGLPLESIPLANLFQKLFEIHKTSATTIYFKNISAILSHPYIRPLFITPREDYAMTVIDTIGNTNKTYLTIDALKAMAKPREDVLDILFSGWNDSMDAVIKKCTNLILLLKNHFDKDPSANLLILEHLFRFHTLFNKLSQLNIKYKHITNVTTLYNIYNELLQDNTLNYNGEPLQGLQIMGLLESQALDFDTLIFTSVNEGILPKGKSQNSFIPFDVRLENNLPTYKEKDAIYAYLFYRLLQRAKKVFIIYNTEADVLTGGEKSRFITQLELGGKHPITQQTLVPQVPVIKPMPHVVQKNSHVLETLKALAQKGFSPSSLTNYIRNPLDFYYDKILKIKPHESVEEIVAPNTLGTVVHNTLEDFYKPLEGHYLSTEIVKNLKTRISETVSKHFKKAYKDGDIDKGKNLIAFEIAKRYIFNFLNQELQELDNGNTVKIIAIETHVRIPIDIPTLDFPVFLTGKIDRVDQYNDRTRIMDYKTGNVTQNQVEVVDWDDILGRYEKYSKSIQVLAYAYMLAKNKQIKSPVEAGIISFKNLKAGWLPFTKKDKSGHGAHKETLITPHILTAFENQLKKLIIEICDPTIDFVEKDV